MLILHVTFRHNLTETTMDATITAANTYPRTVREALAAQWHSGLRHVELIHVKLVGKTAEDTVETP